MNSFKLKPSLFIGSRVLRKIWKESFENDYEADVDAFTDVFAAKFDSRIMNEERQAWFFKLVRQEVTADSTRPVQLHEFVNLTDFIGFADCLSMFEPDRLEQFKSIVKSESSRNYEFDMRSVELQNIL